MKTNLKFEKVKYEIIKNTMWVHISGQTLAMELESNRVSKRKTKNNITNPKIILSPMPGKVTKLFVAEGQQVKEGDSLVVMEAMKMEYTLKSSIAGKVKKINCKINEQVALAVLLVELENENEVKDSRKIQIKD